MEIKYSQVWFVCPQRCFHKIIAVHMIMLFILWFPCLAVVYKFYKLVNRGAGILLPKEFISVVLVISIRGTEHVLHVKGLRLNPCHNKIKQEHFYYFLLLFWPLIYYR